jgi:hypothetical protein
MSKLVILGIISALQAVVLVAIGMVGKKLPATGSFLTHLPLVELLLAVGVLAIVSMTVGLLISALVNSSDKTMPLLVVIVMFQVILTGGIFPLAGKAGINQISWIAPSRWGFAGVASTANLNVIQQPAGAGKAPAGGGGGGGASASPSAGTHKSGAAGKKKHHSAGASASPGSGSNSAAAQPSASSTASTTSAAGSVATDPLWIHKSSVWLKDVGVMILLGLLFSLIAWWRLIKIGPERRR